MPHKRTGRIADTAAMNAFGTALMFTQPDYTCAYQERKLQREKN